MHEFLAHFHLLNLQTKTTRMIREEFERNIRWMEYEGQSRVVGHYGTMQKDDFRFAGDGLKDVIL